MARSRTNAVFGTLSSSLTNNGTTMNAAALAELPSISGGNIAVIVLDPEERAGAAEIVWVTAHTASATSATISRGQEGTTNRAHNGGVFWIHGATALDWDHGNLDGLTDDDHTIYIKSDGTRSFSAEQASVQSAETNNLFTSKKTGDANNRFEIRVDGKHSWGPATGVVDTNLYRGAADQLKTDDNVSIGGGTILIGADCDLYRDTANSLRTGDSLRVGGSLRVDSTSSFYNSATTSSGISIRVTGDTNDRFLAKSGGELSWGDGTNAPDTNLYRSSANTLKTDDSLIVAGSLEVQGSPGAFVPVGALMPWSGGSTPPSGYLLANGQAVSRTTYSALNTIYSALGYPYGTGDGSTTFNVPDIRGRIPVGLDDMGTTDAGRLSVANTLGLSGGEENHLLTINEMPSHRHTIGEDSDAFPSGSLTALRDGYTATGNTGYAGGGLTHNNMQPYILMYWIIKY